MTKLTVSLSEATEMTGLSRSSLYRALSSGRLTARKNGKRVLISVADLTAYLDALPKAPFSANREAA